MTKFSNIKPENGGAQFITGGNKVYTAWIVGGIQGERNPSLEKVNLRDGMTFSNLKDLRNNQNADALRNSLNGWKELGSREQSLLGNCSGRKCLGGKEIQ